MTKSWYVLHVVLGQEKNIVDYIENVLKQGKFGVCIGDVRVPSECVLEVSSGKKRQVKKKIFPGYVLLELALSDEGVAWQEICSCIVRMKGVFGFLGTSGINEKPSPISVEEAREIFQRTGEIKNTEFQPSNVSFSLFEVVKVNDGPFSSFTGVVEDINHEKHKVRVRVEIFGRSTPVELDFLQVEPI